MLIVVDILNILYIVNIVNIANIGNIGNVGNSVIIVIIVIIITIIHYLASSICPPEAAAHRQYSRAPRHSAAAEKVAGRQLLPEQELKGKMDLFGEPKYEHTMENNWFLTRLTVYGRCMYTVNGGCKPTCKWGTPP